MPRFRLCLLLITTSPLLLSSCMTYLNTPKQRIHIATDSSRERIRIDTTELVLSNGSATIAVVRKKQELTICIPGEDSIQAFRLPARNSFNYLFDQATTLGLSSIFHHDHPQRFYYQRNIYLEKNDSGFTTKRFAPNRKGRTNMVLSIPYANSVYKRTTDGYKHSFGFLGISAGVEYFYRNNQSISFQAGAAADLITPFPAPVHIEGIHETSSSIFISARHNHTPGSFGLGYGLCFSRSSWNITHNKDSTFQPRNLTTASLGLSFSAQYRLTKNFRIGLLYQPSFFNLNSRDRISYQHLLSAEMTFNFPFSRELR